jgi:dihydroorotase
MGRVLIRNGNVFDPASGRFERREVEVPSDRDAVVDARGCIVSPGWMDLHCHLREPGHEHKETIATGTRAAAAGGFTTVCAMANSGLPADSVPVVEYIRTRPAHVRVLPVAAVTRGLEGRSLVDMAMLARAGAVAFSDDGRAIRDARVMLRALEYATLVDRPVIVHAEDPDLAEDGVMHDGRVAREIGLPGRPAEAEEAMVERDIALARRTGARLHVAHVSTARAVALIRQAKREGVRVTAEVTPHHLLLTDEQMRSFDGRFKMNPPLRTAQDVAALREGLIDGTIDAIATDHAPHAPEEKETDLVACPPGVVGLETAAAAVWSLVHEGVLDAAVVLRALTSGPARVLGMALPQGDWTVFDPDEEWTVDPARFHSKGRHSPFAGRILRGRVRAVVVGGRVVGPLTERESA